MTRHAWPDGLESVRADLLSTPTGRAAWARAEAELDACWVTVCREGLCVWWVSPDSNHRDYLSGVGPIDCPCKRNDP